MPQDELHACRRDRARWLQGQLDRLPAIKGPDFHGTRALHQAAVDDLAARLSALPDRPRLRAEWNGASVRMLGIRSTSTSGLAAALRNWINRVAKDAARE